MHVNLFHISDYGLIQSPWFRPMSRDGNAGTGRLKTFFVSLNAQMLCVCTAPTVRSTVKCYSER